MRKGKLDGPRRVEEGCILCGRPYEKTDWAEAYEPPIWRCRPCYLITQFLTTGGVANTFEHAKDRRTFLRTLYGYTPPDEKRDYRGYRTAATRGEY